MLKDPQTAPSEISEEPLQETPVPSLRTALIAAEAGDWQTACAVLVENRSPTTPQERFVRDQVLDLAVEQLTPSYRERWNERIGEFLRDLGVGELGTAEARLGPSLLADGEFEQVALLLSRSTLQAYAEAGHKLTLAYLRESCAIGWRNVYLSQLEGLAHEDGLEFLARVADHSPAGPQLRLLMLRVGEDAVAEVIDWHLLLAAYRSYADARRQDKRGAVDAGALLTELLARKLGRELT